ncbi:MAG: hypothetical protein KJ955_07705 [Nanoarchaeota archaeon]|nr:hypothetical protein [Nanoarchaeota archaeon]
MKKNKFSILKLFRYIFGGIAGAILGIFHTIFIDLFKNIGIFVLFAVNPEKRKEIKYKLDMEKRMKLLEEKTNVVQRLLYAVYNDPSYTKRKEGEFDLKQLEKEAKK